MTTLILGAASCGLVLAGILQVNDCSLLPHLRGAFVIATASFGLLQFLKKKKRGEDSGSLCLSKAALFPWAGMAHGQRAALHARLFYCPDTWTGQGQPSCRRDMLGAPAMGGQFAKQPRESTF